MADTPTAAPRRHAAVPETTGGPGTRHEAPEPATPAEPAVALQLLDARSAAAPPDGGAGSGDGAAGASAAGRSATRSRQPRVADLLSLQRSAGNDAVAAVVQRSAPRRMSVQRAAAGPVVQRDKPKVEVVDPSDAEITTTSVPAPTGAPSMKLKSDPVAVEIDARTLDIAAKILSASIKGTPGDALIYGVQPTLFAVYDKDGARLPNGTTELKFPEGLRPAPGVYMIDADTDGGVSRRIMYDPDSKTKDWSLGDVSGVVQDDPKKKAAKAAKGTGAKGPGDPKAGAGPDTGAGTTGTTAPTTPTTSPPGAPDPKGGKTYDLTKFMVKPLDFKTIARAHPGAREYIVIPSRSGSSDKKPGKATTGFAGELRDGSGDKAANAPPWPVSLDGPKMQPTNSTGTFDARINWAAQGDSASGQVIAAVGTDIHYRWEVFDVTAYAKKHASALVAQAKATQALIKAADQRGLSLTGEGPLVISPDPLAKPKPGANAGGPSGSTPAPTGGQAAPTTGGQAPTTGGGAGDITPPPIQDDYGQTLDDLKTSKAGSGDEETGARARNKAFKDEWKNLWKDTSRAYDDLQAGTGDTRSERASNAYANVLALELMPVSAIVTAIGSGIRWLADVFAGERKQMDIPWDKEGTFLVRVITTPRVGHDREGNEVIRPSSVASVVVEVVAMERMVKEALDAPDADVKEAENALKKAQDAKPQDANKIKELTARLEIKRLEAAGDPEALLLKKIEVKEAELKDVKKKWEGFANGPIYKVEHEIDLLKERLKIYRLQESRRKDGQTMAPPIRLNAQLISEVTGQTYPLLLTAGPMADDQQWNDDREASDHHWKVLDATGEDGKGFDGFGTTPSAALMSALKKFGNSAQYGRGTIGVRIPPNVPLENGAIRDVRVESSNADWAIARGRIDDLVATLAALGLIVASAGTAAAVIGAVAAGARLIDRLYNGTLRLDAAAVTDVLAVLGGAGAIAQEVAALRVQKFGDDMFALMKSGAATEAEITEASAAMRGAANLARGIELANEAINYSSVVWGNVTFLNDMLEIAQLENQDPPGITHSEARRRRAMAIGGAVNNNGMFLAGNYLKAREAAKGALKTKGAKPGSGDHTTGGTGGEHGTGGTGGEHGTGGTGGETTTPKPSETTTPKPTEGGEGGTGGTGGTNEAPKPTVTGGGAGTGTGEHGAPGAPGGTGTGARPRETGGGPRTTEPTTGGAPREPGAQTAKERQAAAHKSLQDAARGNGDLGKAASDTLGQGTWKGDIKSSLGKLEGPQRVAAEKALVEARDHLVESTWKELQDRHGWTDLRLENAGTKSFASDIDATIRPVNEAAGPGQQIGDQVRKAAEAAKALSEALRTKLGGAETDAAIDTNIYSFIGEGRISPPDPAGKGAQQHVDLMVGLAEQLRGQNEQQFRDFEQRLGKKLQSGEVGAEAKQLLSDARAFHDARQGEWKTAREDARAKNPKAPKETIDRMAREELLGQKKGELGNLLAAPEPDYGAIMRKQAEINWFAPDAYATPSAFQQAVAHGQRLRGTAKTAGEMSGAEVSTKLREAAGKEPAGSPRAQKLARDAALVESQTRLLDMTLKELASEQQRTPMDGDRVKELENRASGLKKAIAKFAEPIVIGELLGTTMPSDKPSADRLSQSAAASGANLGMLEAHVGEARDVDGKVKAAAKYAGRIAMAEFLGGLRPSDSPIARLIGEFVKSRMGVFEDASPAILRDMFIDYARLTARQGEIVYNDRGEAIGVSNDLKGKFVDDVRGWARTTNDEIQAAAIGAKAYDNPSTAVTKPGTAPTGEGGGPGTGGPGSRPGGPGTGGGEPAPTGGGTDKAPAGKPSGTKGTGKPEEAPGKPAPVEDQTGKRPDEPAGPERTGPPPDTTNAGGTVNTKGTPAINPPGVDQPFSFRLGSLAEGHAVLRRLAAGDGTVLADRGVQLPAGYQSNAREFGLARLPDGTFAIVQGSVGSVGWSNLPPGSEPLAHTHPITPGREINRPGTVSEIAHRIGQSDGDSPSPESLDRVHVFPSAADLRFCAANRVVNHDVHSPYVHTGDGILKTPTGAPGERPVSFNIGEAKHVGNMGMNPVIEASIVAHDSEGNVLFIGRMWAVDVAGRSVISFEPFTGISAPEPKTLDRSRIGYQPGPGETEAGRTDTTKAGGDTKTPAPAPTTDQPAANKPTQIEGGTRVEQDDYAITVMARKDPNARVRIEVEGTEIKVTDIYKRELPSGSGSVLLAEGLRLAKVAPGSDIIVGEVLNQPSRDAFARNEPPDGTPLGKTTARALELLGLTVKGMRWDQYRGKLRIVVKVG
jgi:hypothetical protein